MKAIRLVPILKDLLYQAVEKLGQAKSLSCQVTKDMIQVETPKKEKQGHFASNIAFLLAKRMHCSPYDLAHDIANHMLDHELVHKVQVIKPGFINFFLKDAAFQACIVDILDKKEKFGRWSIEKGKRIYLEFVSANPTGPLHVGHGRGAAYGATLGNLLEAVGCKVHREYYVNDAGRQMHILALSIWLRYANFFEKKTFPFPLGIYQGDYISDLAKHLKQQVGSALHYPLEAFYKACDVSLLSDSSQDMSNIHIDRLMLELKNCQDVKSYQMIFNLGCQLMTNLIRKDLKDFGVEYDTWLHESKLLEEGYIEKGVGRLREQGYAYEKGGAIWFHAKQFGDEKDRVLIRANGEHTYFAADVAYHLHKYSQNFDEMIDVFGADHHGYTQRIHGFLKALGCEAEKLTIILVQFVTLYKGSERISMSTRSGSFVTLSDLVDLVGKDAARFFYVMKKMEQAMDFDLTLATSRSQENPVYYIQYAYARICRVFEKMEAEGLVCLDEKGLQHLSCLGAPEEKKLMRLLSHYPDQIKSCALQRAPHHLTHYLYDLASHFHHYYNQYLFKVDDEHLRCARCCLIKSVQQVIKNGLLLLGVNAPQSM